MVEYFMDLVVILLFLYNISIIEIFFFCILLMMSIYDYLDKVCLVCFCVNCYWMVYFDSD